MLFVKRQLQTTKWKVEEYSNKLRLLEEFQARFTRFVLHRQQTEKDKKNVNFAPPGKISVDAHDYSSILSKSLHYYRPDLIIVTRK